jgi:DNA polymerase-1
MQKKNPRELKLTKEGEPSRNMAAIKDLIKKAYEAKSISVPMTEKGNICTDANTLEETGCPILEKLAAISNDTKIKTAYLPLLQKCITKRIQTSFNPLLETGRTSSFKPNVQQWPRNGAVRECLIPEDGYVFVSCDYDTLELRCLAQILLWRFGSSCLADAIRGGCDVHLMVAAQLSGVSYDEAFDMFQKDVDIIVENRQRAKVANFGFAGGMGPATFVKYAAGAGLNITLDDAFKLRGKWLDTWPEMHRYFNVAAERTGDFGDKALTCWVSGRQVSGVTFSAYCNYQFQALAADGAKGALYETVRLCNTDSGSALYGSHPYNFIHDQIILETPREQASRAGEELQRVMIDEMQKWLPDVPVSASSVLMERWYKKAKTVRNDKGELQIWKPKKG